MHAIRKLMSLYTEFHRYKNMHPFCIKVCSSTASHTASPLYTLARLDVLISPSLIFKYSSKLSLLEYNHRRWRAYEPTQAYRPARARVWVWKCKRKRQPGKSKHRWEHETENFHKETGCEVWIWSGTGYNPVAAFCGHGNGLSDSIKMANFLTVFTGKKFWFYEDGETMVMSLKILCKRPLKVANFSTA
jgi:hypothetical protein